MQSLFPADEQSGAGSQVHALHRLAAFDALPAIFPGHMAPIIKQSADAPRATGAQTHDIAKTLGLGEETVRSHLKELETKLGVRTRAHAVAEALRQNLIP